MTHSKTPQGVDTRFPSRETLEEFIYDHYDIDSIVLADGFDDAFVGVSYRAGQGPVATYSYWACVEILMKQHGMDFDDALEYFEYNTLGSYIGDLTPVFVKIAG